MADTTTLSDEAYLLSLCDTLAAFYAGNCPCPDGLKLFVPAILRMILVEQPVLFLKRKTVQIIIYAGKYFVGISGSLSSPVHIIGHWCPLKDLICYEELEKLEEADIALDEFRGTCDPTYYAIRILLRLFPELREQACFQDLIKRRHEITDDQGNRLYGSKPYENDPNLAEQIDLT